MVCINQINNNPSALSNVVGMSGLSTVCFHPLQVCQMSVTPLTLSTLHTIDLQDTLEVHKESIPNCCIELFICWLALQHVLADLIGHLQGGFYTVCSVCFNLPEISHMIKIEVVVGVWPQHANFIILYFYTVLLVTSCILTVTYYNIDFNYIVKLK